jgi:hypothetical protein
MPKKRIKRKAKLGEVYVPEMNARHECEVKLARRTSPTGHMVKITDKLFVAPRANETDQECINRITQKLKL